MDQGTWNKLHGVALDQQSASCCLLRLSVHGVKYPFDRKKTCQIYTAATYTTFCTGQNLTIHVCHLYVLHWEKERQLRLYSRYMVFTYAVNSAGRLTMQSSVKKLRRRRRRRSSIPQAKPVKEVEERQKAENVVMICISLGLSRRTAVRWQLVGWCHKIKNLLSHCYLFFLSLHSLG